MPQDMVGGVGAAQSRAPGAASPGAAVGDQILATGDGERAREALAGAAPVLTVVAGGVGGAVGGEVTDAERARALVAARSASDVVLSIDVEGLGPHVARLKAADAGRGAGVEAEVARLLPSAERARFAEAVEDNAPGLLGRAWGGVTDAAEWVRSRPGALREWHDGHRPETLLGHVGDGVATLGVGILDIAQFADSTARVLLDTSPLGQAADDIERVWGGELPGWVPSEARGFESLASAGETVAALARDPGLIWDGLTDGYARLWAEERYGGLVGQVVADFGDVLLGSKGAGRTAGALSDLARAGHLARLDTVTDVLVAARRADAVAPGEFVRVSRELAAIKRADGTLGQLADAARRTDTLPDLLGRGVLERADVDELIRSGELTLDEAARVRLPVTGARYIESVATPEAIAGCDAIVARVDDVAAIAAATGLGANVVARLESQFFVQEHAVAVGPGDVRTGRFTPDQVYADDWTAAAAGMLTSEDLARFRRFVGHEYVEAKLMEAGLPCRSAHPEAFHPELGPYATPDRFGAHDLAPHGNLARSPFSHHEPMLGRRPPALPMADDLSNLDAVVAGILEGLR